MFKTRYRRKMKMLAWLRLREWFNEDIPEYQVYEMIPKAVLDKLLDAYEDWDIFYTYYCPNNVNLFWEMFQSVKRYIELVWETDKKIALNLDTCTKTNKELRDIVEKEKENILKRIIKLRPYCKGVKENEI